MRAAASDAKFFDQNVGVARAGLPVTSKHVCKLEVTSFVSLGINVIFVSAATFFYAEIHDSFDIREKLSKLLIRHIAHPRRWVDFRHPERFIGVDIPYPSKHSLVENRGFYRRITAPPHSWDKF